MTLREIRIEYGATWSETVEVEIPDGLTQAELDVVLDEVVETHTPDPPDSAIDCDSADVVGDYECAPPDLTLRAINEDHWIEWEGARWVTDKIALLREGSPMPLEMYSEWGEAAVWQKGKTAEDIDRGVGERTTRPFGGVLHKRFAPVIAGARVCGLSDMSPAFVYRDGVLVAVLMPMREAGPDTIKADGTPSCAGAA